MRLKWRNESGRAIFLGGVTTMSKTYTYTLPSQAKVFIEGEDAETETPTTETREVFRTGQDTPAPFAEVVAPIGEVAEAVFDAVKSKVSKPDQITLEFGATLKGGVNLFLVSGKTDTTFKVTLSWKNE